MFDITTFPSKIDTRLDEISLTGLTLYSSINRNAFTHNSCVKYDRSPRQTNLLDINMLKRKEFNHFKAIAHQNAAVFYS